MLISSPRNKDFKNCNRAPRFPIVQINENPVTAKLSI
jgi:hypothetical protein